ncbi:MAG: HAMP domain-containing histidine kinase [Clostridia bacterium]|nr:HAMP domain-containing histidine kinase [Clostridia bacterium]
MKSSIKSRWIKHILLVIVAILFLFSCIIIYSASTRYYNSAELTIRARNSKSVDTFFSTYNSADPDSFTLGAYKFVENFLYRDIMEVWVIDKNGKMIVSSSGFNVSTSTQWEDYELALTAPDNIGVKRQRLDSGEPVTAMSYILRDDAGRNYGAVRYLISMDEMYDQLFIIVLIVLVAFILIVVLITVSGMYFVSSIVNPVTDICKTTGEIAKGDFSARINTEHEDDEIGQLCSSINNMALQLSEIDKMKNDFISTVSHEIRTPLTAIKGWGETLKNVNYDKSILDKGLDIIVDETARLSVMVEELLDFSRMQSSGMKIISRRFNLSELLVKSVSFLNKKADEECIALRYTPYDGEDIYINGDPDKIRQVIINIIDNAIKYTQKDGIVEVKVEIAGKHVKISVSDNGCGISKKDLPHIKEKFYKANNTVRGTGIGLAVADEIVKKHSGEINISSEISKGTTVEIVLPADNKEEE